MSNLSAQQAENYYQKDDYYSQDLAAKAQPWVASWQGKGAAALGLTGAVEQAAFQKLLHGKTPQGRSLHAKRIDPTNHRAATDYTFSAPKSVSIAALVQQDARVLRAHDQAVKFALAVLEERFVQTRISTPQGRQRITTGNIVAAVFQHQTSREQDPQLHSHCVVINATQLDDGSWRSLSNEAIVVHQKLLGQIYQNELAYQLGQLGYQIQPRANGQFELADYNQTQLKAFSTRTQQIQAYLDDWQQRLATEARLPLEAHQKKQAALNTRRSKQTLPREVLLEAWQQQIQAQQLDLPALPIPIQAATEGGEFEVQAAVADGIAQAAERETVFRRSKIERFVLEQHLGKFPFEKLQQAITNHSELILVDVAGEKYTTQTAIHRELDTIRLMQQGKGRVAAIASPEEVTELLRSFRLTTGQREAVTLAATTPAQFVAWQGVAGAGKTYALRLYKELAEPRGYQLRGFAPSAQAAAELAQATSIPSDTIASLLYSPSLVHPTLLPGKEIWVVDEASLLGAKDAHALLQRAHEQQARILLVGDTRQLSAVEAGSPFRSLQAGGIATARLDESLRQQTQELKFAVALVAQNRVVEGVQALDQAGCIREVADPERRLAQLVDDYLELSPQERHQTLLLAGTNQQQLDLTQHLRRQLQQEGSLGGDTFTLMSLRQKNLTAIQTYYATAYEAGDVLVPQQDYRKQGLYKYQHYTVSAQDQTSNQLTLADPTGRILQINPAHCPKKTLYQMQPLSVASGDHLRWTKNNRKVGIRNGQAFILDHVSSDGTAQITSSNGQTSQIDLGGKQHLDYAWVSTVHNSQGKTADRVFALMDSTTTNQESFYVTVSRARQQLRLYTNDKVALAEQAQKMKAKENVSDYILLFQGVPNYVQTSQTATHIASVADDRDSANRARQTSTGDFPRPPADHERTICPAPASSPTGTANAADPADHSAAAADVERQVELLSAAIKDYFAERDLIDCTNELTAAVAAVDRGIEYLEQSAQSRSQLAAAVDRLNAAIGAETRSSQPAQQLDLDEPRKDVEPQQETGPALPPSQNDTHLPPNQQYRQLWQRYSQGVRASNLVQQDYLVAKRAFEAGCSPKQIALMLTAGSPYVQQIHQTQGGTTARDYVNQTAKLTCSQAHTRKRPSAVQKKANDLEL